MSAARRPAYEWADLEWSKIERQVYKLQKRIYRASQRGDHKAVHRLQRLLMTSWSAKCRAVRRVTQDNRGKKTAGVDGLKSLSPARRVQLVSILSPALKPHPLRRVWIPKPGSKGERRGRGIPVIGDRAAQALIKLALAPEWEAHFEPHSYGFRPGRSCHDAIGAIFTALTKRATYVLDADIAKCFDRVNHLALLNKLRTFPPMRRAIKGWLKAGVMDGAELFPTEEGTPQGGVISPLLANIALHGLETAITTAFPLERKLEGTRVRWTPKVIRYADDFVVLHHDRATIETCKQLATEWLHGLGLELKPSKTRIGHTLDEHDGRIGFDFLGLTIRQYRVSLGRSAKDMKGRRLGFKTIITPSQESQRRHQEQIGALIRAQRMATQADLIGKLNPIIKGWTTYHRAVASMRIFSKMDHLTYLKLRSWAKRRHPQKSGMWVAEHYWHIDSDHHWTFRAKNGLRLHNHADTRIVRHDKVIGARSVYDGDWVYWASRLGRHPDVPGRVAALLRKQKGTCVECGLHFAMEDLIEIDHIVPQGRDGTDEPGNRQLLHAHCHDVKTARDAASGGVPMTRAG